MCLKTEAEQAFEKSCFFTNSLMYDVPKKITSIYCLFFKLKSWKFLHMREMRSEVTKGAKFGINLSVPCSYRRGSLKNLLLSNTFLIFL